MNTPLPMLRIQGVNVFVDSDLLQQANSAIIALSIAQLVNQFSAMPPTNALLLTPWGIVLVKVTNVCDYERNLDDPSWGWYEFGCQLCPLNCYHGNFVRAIAARQKTN